MIRWNREEGSACNTVLLELGLWNEAPGTIAVTFAYAWEDFEGDFEEGVHFLRETELPHYEDVGGGRDFRKCCGRKDNSLYLPWL